MSTISFKETTLLNYTNHTNNTSKYALNRLLSKIFSQPYTPISPKINWMKAPSILLETNPYFVLSSSEPRGLKLCWKQQTKCWTALKTCLECLCVLLRRRRTRSLSVIDYWAIIQRWRLNWVGRWRNMLMDW